MNKGGYVYVMDRKTGELVNTWPLSENINWVKSVNPKTGELSGRDQPEIGTSKLFCPSVPGSRSWNAGAYSPKTKLWYTNAHEFCNRVTVADKNDPKKRRKSGKLSPAPGPDRLMPWRGEQRQRIPVFQG